jgi:hypothetical protein
MPMPPRTVFITDPRYGPEPAQLLAWDVQQCGGYERACYLFATNDGRYVLHTIEAPPRRDETFYLPSIPEAIEIYNHMPVRLSAPPGSTTVRASRSDALGRPAGERPADDGKP